MDILGQKHTHCRGEGLSAALALARNLSYMFSISFRVVEGNNLPMRVKVKKH